MNRKPVGEFPHPQQYQQTYDMYRGDQYQMGEYDLSAYQSMDPNSLDAQNDFKTSNLGNKMSNLSHTLPTDSNLLNANFENKPNVNGNEPELNTKSQFVNQNSFYNPNFNDTGNSNRDRNVLDVTAASQVFSC